ncbi:MAG TPA: RsmE family RNA methyltransferase [Candidatus Acidoferrales bacterium]|nr:RsmE family RNA methyltransferase [Candidatus Acidoferrales bacterium]
MHRFYLPPEKCTGDVLQLEGREAHHALHVLRVKRGEPVVVLDGAGHEFLCEIADASRAAMMLRVKQKDFIPPPSCQITLLQAVPRGKIIESIIQKSVELGAHRILPLLTERVVTHLADQEKTQKLDKWQQVAVEAIKQCGAAWLPEIETPMPIEEALARRSAGFRPGPSGLEHTGSGTSAPGPAPGTGSDSVTGSSPAVFDLSLVGSLQAGRRHPRDCFLEFQARNGRLPQSVAAWIGPEGDFTTDELRMIEASGALPISLGRLTLRVETAAIYCLSILNYELNR